MAKLKRILKVVYDTLNEISYYQMLYYYAQGSSLDLAKTGLKQDLSEKPTKLQTLESAMILKA